MPVLQGVFGDLGQEEGKIWGMAWEYRCKMSIEKKGV
jgi:hypothetical protein